MGLVGFLALFFPGIVKFRVLISLLVLTVPILLVAVWYLGQFINLAYKKLTQYESLHKLILSPRR